MKKIVKESLFEAFEEKSKEKRKEDMLYPEFVNIKTFIDLKQLIRSKKYKVEDIPKWKLDEILKPIKTIDEVQSAFFSGISYNTFPQIEDILNKINNLKDLKIAYYARIPFDKIPKADSIIAKIDNINDVEIAYNLGFPINKIKKINKIIQNKSFVELLINTSGKYNMSFNSVELFLKNIDDEDSEFYDSSLPNTLGGLEKKYPEILKMIYVYEYDFNEFIKWLSEIDTGYWPISKSIDDDTGNGMIYYDPNKQFGFMEVSFSTDSPDIIYFFR